MEVHIFTSRTKPLNSSFTSNPNPLSLLVANSVKLFSLFNKLTRCATYITKTA